MKFKAFENNALTPINAHNFCTASELEGWKKKIFTNWIAANMDNSAEWLDYMILYGCSSNGIYITYKGQ